MVLTRILQICWQEASGNEYEASEKKRHGKEMDEAEARQEYSDSPGVPPYSDRRHRNRTAIFCSNQRYHKQSVQRQNSA